jgi:hypothetical protein
MSDGKWQSQMSDGKSKLASGTTPDGWYSFLDETTTFDRQIRQISPIRLPSLRFTHPSFLTTYRAERISSWLAGSAREL